MTFRNPANGYTLTYSHPRWLVFFFGTLYLIFLGLWKEVLITLVTGGIAIFYYLFAIPGVIRAHYLQRGWEEVQ